MPSPQPPAPSSQLLRLDPVPALLTRLRQELSADFDSSRPIRISRAPGRLDVMGGIADYTGSLVCEATLDRAAALALQPRSDREIQVFSFNLLDEHQPFTLRIPLDAMISQSVEALRRGFAEPGRKWAGYLAGCLYILHERQLIDLHNPSITGLNLALLSTIPLGAGVASSAAIEVAAMMALVDHLGIREQGELDAMTLASLCQEVENRIVGAPCGIMDQVTSICGQPDSLLRLLCQPHALQPPLNLPANIQVLGINSNVKHSLDRGEYGRTRCAAFMGHRIILEKMREMASAAGKTLAADPMNGYLANLEPEDYKKLFRPYLPTIMKGIDFLEKFGPTIDKATVVNPAHEYPIRSATDHHVLEARRVRQFVEFLEAAAKAPPGTREQGEPLDKAGHLMYASHLSYTNNALLGAPACDLLVDLVRRHEPSGLYGAKITGGGSGGTIAILADKSPTASAAIDQIMHEYHRQTGHKPEAFTGSSPGAFSLGTSLIP